MAIVYYRPRAQKAATNSGNAYLDGCEYRTCDRFSPARCRLDSASERAVNGKQLCGVCALERSDWSSIDATWGIDLREIYDLRPDRSGLTIFSRNDDRWELDLR